VIAIGGGSAVDVGKVLSAVLTNDDDIFNYLEVIGKGMPIQNKPLPFIAIPTTRYACFSIEACRL
jgi:alcohol dehydrogenase class IV